MGAGLGAFDLVILGGRVVDGSGAPGFAADVGIRGDRIAAVGDLSAARAGVRVDAGKHVVAPGFIDVHSHDDGAVLLHPTMDFKLRQGVTTDVVGNCGLGAAPHAAATAVLRAFHPGRTFPAWEGHRGYRAALESEPPSCNVGVLVGHNTLRGAVLGLRRDAPSAGELAAMQELVREGMAAGALGFSTGLVYEPGRHATTEEVIALARVAGEAGGLYATHMRDEGARLLDSIRETLRIGDEAGIPVQISHHKAAGRESWGLVRASLGLIEEARARGLDATADQYPYTAASTVLAAVLQQRGLSGGAGGGGVGRMEPGDVRVASAPGHPEWEGRTLVELAATLGCDAETAARRVVDEAPGATAIFEIMNEDDVRLVMRHPTTMIGSDGLPSLEGKPHPRLYGTFPRVLGRYVRALGVLALEEAVHRMTGLPARKFRLADRGAVREGAFADLVVFDPATVCDTGSYDDPHRFPAGIPHVLVNGRFVVRDGAHTGARPGRCLGPA
jgi:N-acyl-D-amino-acid deacylase